MTYVPTPQDSSKMAHAMRLWSQAEMIQKLRRDLTFARIGLFRWFAAGVLTGAGSVLIVQVFSSY